MIKLLQSGDYELLETKNQIKILVLGNKEFAWLKVGGVGEILVTTHKSHKQDHMLSVGQYRLYAVKDEPNLVDEPHLELHTGKRKWQGYLLPTGLPTNKKKRALIIPTPEVISNPTD